MCEPKVLGPPVRNWGSDKAFCSNAQLDHGGHSANRNSDGSPYGEKQGGKKSSHSAGDSTTERARSASFPWGNRCR